MDDKIKKQVEKARDCLAEAVITALQSKKFCDAKTVGKLLEGVQNKIDGTVGTHTAPNLVFNDTNVTVV